MYIRGDCKYNIAILSLKKNLCGSFGIYDFRSVPNNYSQKNIECNFFSENPENKENQTNKTNQTKSSNRHYIVQISPTIRNNQFYFNPIDISNKNRYLGGPIMLCENDTKYIIGLDFSNNSLNSNKTNTRYGHDKTMKNIQQTCFEVSIFITRSLVFCV